MASGLAALPLPPLPYASTRDALTKMLSLEGVRGFYRGFGAVLLVSPLASSAYFSAYEFSKRFLAEHTSLEADLGASSIFVLSGVVAQSVAGCLYTPQDVIKERLQVQRIASRPRNGLLPATVHYRSSAHAATSIWRAEGVKGLFRGYTAANAAWWPWNVLYFVSYEHAREALAAHRGLPNKEALLPAHSAACATLAATFATMVTNPVDVVKTRLQALQHGSKTVTALSIARGMLATEGPRAFGTGMGARVLSIAPGSFITFFAFEQLLLLLK